MVDYTGVQECMANIMQTRVTSDDSMCGYIRSDGDSDRERHDPEDAKCQEFVVEFSVSTFSYVYICGVQMGYRAIPTRGG